jgi:hypothetical protein
MMKLTFNNLTRTETNQLVIGNLQRKGWTLIVPPVVPEYDLEHAKVN